MLVATARRDVTRTTCPYCGVGCGVLAKPSACGTDAEICGDPDHPANYGRLCSKGSALGETLSLADRLLYPMANGQQVGWEAALDQCAGAFSTAIRDHGPDSVALYVSGQILTEDYYVANKLMKGFVGTANIDTNSRLCMASSVAGHKRAFGTDTVPGVYEDLECADLVVLVGSNLAWCHPVLYQRLSAARKNRGTKIVVIDPRETATCEIADLHLPIKPGMDVALFNGLLAHIDAVGLINQNYISEHTTGFENALAEAQTTDFTTIANACGLPLARVVDFYNMWAKTERTVTVYSQGVNQSTAGTDKVNAIINCHLATGRIGRPGMGPFSVTGQPNAMGGRETGGLANMLAAHMELANPTHRRIVQDFWRSPVITDTPGFKAVDLFDAVGDGRIKALWIMATNPVDSLPEADRVRAAIDNCPFVAVSDVTRHTDTTALADVLLPALAWGEKDGTVTNSERRVSRQRAFLNPPGEARADWWQICEVAKKLGHAPAFSYAGPSEIYAEYAALTGASNEGSRDLDISAHSDISKSDYDALEPFQWPKAIDQTTAKKRFFADGGFYTDDGRARFITTPIRSPATETDNDFPFVLNTGRIRDQWHTMTRTAKSPRLMSHRAEPFLEIHPEDAATLGLSNDKIARVKSRAGEAYLRVSTTTSVRKGEVFAPIHWTDEYASRARIDALVGAYTDPVSGQPEAKFTPVSVTPHDTTWYACALSTQTFKRPAVDYHALAPVKDGTRIELAHSHSVEDWDSFADELFAISDADEADLERLTYRDARAGQYRFALLQNGQLVAALFVSPSPVTVSRTWAASHLGKAVAPEERLHLLAGRPGADMPDKGAIVCSCFEVGANEIAEAVRGGGCNNVEAVGNCLKAGTNCGSCRAEIGRIVDANRVSEAV
ncbi:MAG: molybdopterin-dependent oxidoreductase [Filomicrobium sp.]